jgi:hypothetical protein
MAYRTAGTFAIKTSNTVQPLFGSWVTGVSPAGGFTGPSMAPLTLTLGTAQNAGNDAAQIFLPGEPAWLVDPSVSKFGGVHGEEVRIASISANTLVLGPKTLTNSRGQTALFTENAHATGALGTGSYLIPKQMVNNFLVQYEDGGTGPFLYLGNTMLMTGVLYRFYKLATAGTNTQPGCYDASMTSPGNPYDLSELWVYCANATDKYNVSLNIA